MKVPPRRARALVPLLVVGATLDGCDNWPVQHDAPGTGAPVPPEQPDAGSTCLTLFPIQPSTSTEINGSLCYGLAVNSSSALECAASANPNVTECADALLGTAYSVRWSGSSATVQAAFSGAQIGSVTQRDANTFSVATAAHTACVCTFELGPPGRVDFCLQAQGG